MKLKRKKKIPKNITKQNIDLFNQALGNEIGNGSAGNVCGVGEALDESAQTKAWMVRRDGKPFEMSGDEFHPYGSQEDYEETMWACSWLYDHTASKETKKTILQFIVAWVYDETEFTESTVADQLIKENEDRPYNFVSEDFIKRVAGKLEKIDIEGKDIEELNQEIINDLNNEFIRVRAGGEVNSDYSLGDLYFRVSSNDGFNWFDIIWDFVYNRSHTTDTVSVLRDKETTGRNDFYRHGRYVFDRIPTDDFLMLKGHPFIGESLRKVNMRLRLLEAEGFDDDEEVIEDEIVDEEPEEEVIPEDEPQDDGKLQRKEISFPLLFVATKEDGTDGSVDDGDKEEIAQQYADAVIVEVEDNKKFILSALDTYDLECYYDKLDANFFAHFIVSTDSDLTGDLIWNVLKRYFNTQIDDVEQEIGNGEVQTVSVNPVLENKFIKII